MRMRYLFALNIIDKAIIAFALFLVTLDVSEGLQNIGWTLFGTVFLVFMLYIGVVLFANIPALFVAGSGRWTKMIMSFFTGLIVFLLFPFLLKWILFFMGVELSMPVETVLMLTFVIRAAIGVYLHRRWEEA